VGPCWLAIRHAIQNATALFISLGIIRLGPLCRSCGWKRVRQGLSQRRQCQFLILSMMLQKILLHSEPGPLRMTLAHIPKERQSRVQITNPSSTVVEVSALSIRRAASKGQLRIAFLGDRRSSGYPSKEVLLILCQSADWSFRVWGWSIDQGSTVLNYPSLA
jgi:hypothetical protein